MKSEHPASAISKFFSKILSNLFTRVDPFDKDELIFGIYSKTSELLIFRLLNYS